MEQPSSLVFSVRRIFFVSLNGLTVLELENLTKRFLLNLSSFFFYIKLQADWDF